MSRRANRLLQFAGSRRSQTIFDQVIVSGSNFITGIILVRGLGLEAFGKFTVAYAILLLANSIQLSFISSPMITLGSLCLNEEEKGRFVRGMFGTQVLFCAVVSVGTLAASIAYIHLDSDTASAGTIAAFMTAVVAYLMQDWLRRYYFTVNRAKASVWNDGISYLGQVILLCMLIWTHQLTIETAFWAVAVSSGFAFALGALLEHLRTTLLETRDAWRQCRGISINLGISNQLQWLVYQGAMLVGASVVGSQAAGAVRATQNVIGPVNIAFQAMENIVPIRAAEEMRRGGIPALTAFLFKFGLTGFVALLILFSAASLVSDRFLAFFYGSKLGSYAGVLNLQMLYFLLAWPVRQLTFLFRTMKDTRPILMSSILAAAVSIALVYPMVQRFGAMGIVMAAVSGQTGNLLYLIFAWAQVRARLGCIPQG